MVSKKQHPSKLNYDLKTSVASQLYRDVKGKVERKFNKNAFYAWMKHKEIDLISELILNLKPSKCLEWGAGYSTLTFPKLLNSDFEWLSVEHDQVWSDKINAINPRLNVSVKCIPPDNYPFSDEHNDGNYTDMKSYIEFPPVGQDFILVDGRARAFCVRKSFDLLNSDGFVVLHDANRQHYHQFFNLFKHQELFLDYHKGRRGIWIGSKNRPVDEVVNLSKYQKIWAIHNRIGKFFRKK